MKRIGKGLLFCLVLLVIFYFSGPKWPIPKLDNSPSKQSWALDSVQDYVDYKELQTNDSTPSKTTYSIVYLHGFGASKAEGDPVHRAIAKKYGFNLYLSRLHQHGVKEDEPFKNLDPALLLESAKEAIAIGKTLGDSVILICCSTGATLGFYLAAKDPKIASVIALSPNIDLYDQRSGFLTGPWGLQLARLLFQSDYRGFEANDSIKKFWINHYRLEGLISLKALVEATMTNETFEQIKQPVFMGYYYKNEAEQDKVISIKRAQEVFEYLPCHPEQKQQVAFPNAKGHVFSSKYYSSDFNEVIQKISSFIELQHQVKPL
jgi:pimeloyl-ACP methyl ester carboxylesterase